MATHLSCSGRMPTSCHHSTRSQLQRPVRHNLRPQSCRPSTVCRGAPSPEQNTSDSAKGEGTSSSPQKSTTEKFGLEAGLFSVFTSKNSDNATKTSAAKQLLTQYGGAYLLTSTCFALVSFALCYAAVNAGVDVPSLLARVGIQVSEQNEKVGTVAIAYAAHKALSPVRFPPTVALTPVVAKWLGQKKVEPEVEVKDTK